MQRDELKEDFGYGGDAPFTVDLPYQVAWLVAQKICPGPSFGFQPNWKRIADLRQKIHEALIYFDGLIAENPESKEVPHPFVLSITPDEAWILDQVVPFDGVGGDGANFLMALYRGLYARYKDIPIELTERLRQPRWKFDNLEIEKEELPKQDSIQDLEKRDFTAEDQENDEGLTLTS